MGQSKKAPPHALIDRMLRVDYAGECGAQSIYKGQLWALRDESLRAKLEEMLAQEKEHADAFEKWMQAYQVRPSLLMPFWNVCGFAMGALTAKMGPQATMACTTAVETVIEQHYAGQEKELEPFQEARTKKLCAFLAKCREEEAEHKEAGIDHGAHEAPAFLHQAIQRATRCAIWLSERI